MLFNHINNRLQASGLHFLLSLGILFVLLALMFCLWFPGETFLYDGGLQGLKILIPVDLILGPLLTLIVFNTHKKSLKADLAIIALVQVLALSWGVHQIHSVRSHFIVYYDNTFTSVTADDMALFQTMVKGHAAEDLELPLKSWYEKTTLVTLKPTQSQAEADVRKNRVALGRTFGTGGPIYNYELYADLDKNPPSDAVAHTGYFRYFTTDLQYDSGNQQLHSIKTNKPTSWLDLLLAQ